MQAIRRGQAGLVLSAVVFVEILPTRSPTGVYGAFRTLVALPAVEVVDVTAHLAARAGTIRDAGLSERPPRKIKAPDALVLATALRHADELHTDERRLARLDRHPTVGGLRIVGPS